MQNLKLARLKPVTKSKALTCTMRSYDPKKASPMISRHSNCFRALNAPFFFYSRFHLFKVNLYIERFLTMYSKKKVQTLFCLKIICFCHKLIPKVMSNSLESTLCDYEALNAPKSNLTHLARLKDQNNHF